ncbi:AI-2E family transporter [Methylolobus aquaticus]|nr:AI-2E family transporter [Methylolobus aquaticus]
MRSDLLFSPPARAVLVAGSCALVIGLMKLAAPILTPILLAVFITIVATPALRWLRRHGVPKWGALALIVFVLLDLGSLFALITTGALEGFRESLPSYQERFLLLSDQFGRWAESVGIGGSREAVPDLMDPNKVVGVVRLLLSNAGDLLATGLMVLLIVIFMLLEAPALPAKLSAAFHLTEEGDARLKKLVGSINHYMLIKTAMSLATGVCAWLLLHLLEIDFAVLWGVLAFFLNFVPVVGGIVMMIPPVLLALVQTDLQTTALVLGGYLAIHVVIGDVLEPRIMGKGLGISALTILIALLFWGWLFGTTGMFLSVPLTTALVIALDASPHTRPIAILLGPGAPETGSSVKDPKLG